MGAVCSTNNTVTKINSISSTSRSYEADDDDDSSRSPSATLDNYGHLCRSTVSHILSHKQLARFAASAKLFRYEPKEVIYEGGDQVNGEAIYYLVEGSAAVTKLVELKETTVLMKQQEGVLAGGPLTRANTASMVGNGNGNGMTTGRNTGRTSAHLSHYSISAVPTTSVPARWCNSSEKPDNAFPVKLRELQPNQWFGYCTMLNMTVRQATVTALEHTTCLVWSVSALNEFFSAYPGISSLIRSGIAGEKVMRELCNSSFLTNLQEDHAALLCTLFQSRYIPANTVVFEEGEPPTENSSLFFLVSGSAVMYQNTPGGGQSLVKAIEAGQIFGEACMLFRLPRIGTVRTNHESLVMELSFSAFTQFLKFTPGLGVDVRKAFNNNSIGTHYLLMNPVISHAFGEFCNYEHSSENVDFYRDAKAFRTSSTRQKALLVMDAKKIFTDYIDISSKKQVNLFSSTREKIAQAVEHQIINKLTFEEAEEEILHLMDRDSFARFKASGLFQEALQKCRDKASA